MAVRITAKELMLCPPDKQTTSIVEELLRTNRGRPSLLCGFPGSGKSTLAHQLAVAVAHGEPFLGRETTPGHVVYWSNEDSLFDLREDFMRLGMTEDTSISFQRPDPNGRNFTALGDTLLSCPDTRLVIIETLADFLQVKDITNNDDCRNGLQSFCDMIIAPNPDCSFLMLHHFNKSDVGSGLASAKILGATALAGLTDTKIYLRQVSDDDRRRIIHTEVRKGRNIESTYLEFDPETLRATLGSTVRDESILHRKETKALAQFECDTTIMQTIFANQYSSKWEIVKLVGGNAQNVGVRIDQMMQSGLIHYKLGGDKGNAKLLYIPIPSYDSTSPFQSAKTLQ
jgi:RecA-family ATPase